MVSGLKTHSRVVVPDRTLLQHPCRRAFLTTHRAARHAALLPDLADTHFIAIFSNALRVGAAAGLVRPIYYFPAPPNAFGGRQVHDKLTGLILDRPSGAH